MTGLRSSPLLPLLVVASACAPDASGGPPLATVRDSAGVVIVENPALEQVPSLPWTVGPEPALTIGALDGPEEYQLYQVRRAHRLDDGRILVANGGSSEIRAYDASGLHLGSWGGQGQGPGEFVRMVRMDPWPVGDSVAVWDTGLRRLSVYATDGGFGRTLTIPAVEDVDLPSYFGTLPGGSLVITGMSFPESANGMVRPPMTFALMTTDGTPVATLGTFPGTETVMSTSGGIVAITAVPFARGTVAAPAGDRMIIAYNDRFELPVFTADEGLSRLVRVEMPPRPVSDALRTAEIERRVSNAPEQARPGLRTSLETMELPPSLPVFSGIRGDAVGNIWVELYRPPTEPGPTDWLVLDRDGQALGRFSTPEGLTVFQIGGDFILGAMEDELEVEHVQLWSLSR
jgi:hypothetical protein